MNLWKNLNYQKPVSLLLASAGTCGIGMELSMISLSSSAYGELLLLPCMYLLYRAYVKCFSIIRGKRFYCFTAGLSILYSLMLTAGGLAENMLELPLMLTAGGVLFLVAAVYPVLCALTLYLDGREKTAGKESGKNKKIRWICFAVTALMWFLTYLAVFPGVYGTDAPYWFYEFSIEEVPVSSQWSPLYCAGFYYLVVLGWKIFGTYDAGFAVFSFVQMALILLSVWKMLSFLDKRFPDTAVILAAAFWAFLPTHAILGLTSAQDPVFAACFGMCILYLFELSENPGMFFGSKKEPVKLFIWMLLLCMIRNNGIYAVFVMAFFAVVFMRKYRRQVICIVLAVSAGIFIYQGPVYHVLGIETGTALREMLSFPLQQMAYVYNYEKENLSDDEIRRMLLYLSDDGWRSYEPCISDHVKSQLDTALVKADIAAFAGLYLDVLRASPRGYMKGAALQTFGLWYPNKQWPDARTWHPYITYLCWDTLGLYGQDFTVTRASLFPLYDKVLGALYGRGDDHSGYGGNLSMIFSKIPVFGMLCKAGTYFWMMLYLFFYALYQKWRRPFLMIGLGMGILLTILLSPVILYRYCAPVIFTSPLFLAVLFVKWDEEEI